MGVLGFFMSFGRGLSTLLVGFIWRFMSLETIFLVYSGLIFLLVILTMLASLKPFTKTGS
jgi:hypothetical protein